MKRRKVRESRREERNGRGKRKGKEEAGRRGRGRNE